MLEAKALQALQEENHTLHNCFAAFEEKCL